MFDTPAAASQDAAHLPVPSQPVPLPDKGDMFVCGFYTFYTAANAETRALAFELLVALALAVRGPVPAPPANVTGPFLKGLEARIAFSAAVCPLTLR